MFRAAIIGGTGYGGAELCRQLLHHPDVELCRVSAIDSVGKKLGDVHLNLAHVTDLRFEDLPPQEAAKGMDAVFLGLPHTVSCELAPKLLDSGAKVIDLSGDFRLRDAATYAKHYHHEHPHPELLGTFVYGLPELNRAAIREADRIASPGCFATAIGLGLVPFARAGWLNSSVSTVACTGSSGSGAYASASTHHPVRAANLKAYKILGHQHRPEIEQTVRDAGAAQSFRIDFVPVSAPLVRGILATSLFEVPAETTADDVRRVLAEAFGDSPFIKLLEGREPEVVAVAGTNYVELGFKLGDKDGARRPIAVITAIDNLVKGGAGQAVQSMNIALGLAEDAGLVGYYGIWP